MEESAVILIVDDMPEQLRITASLLKEHGYSVRAAISGSAALHLVEREIPDLILLDIHMDDIDGFTVCQKLRSSSRYEDTAILFMTASGDHDSLQKGFEAGAQDYIIKPCHASELLARVSTHVQIVTQARRLKAAYQEMDQFCHSVSHDLKSPVQVMKQLTGCLREELFSSPTGIAEGTEAILSRLDEKCIQMESMIGRLLDFSQMTTVKYHPELLDAAAMIREIFEELSSLEPDRVILLSDSQFACPPIPGDPTLLRLLFQNIIGHAVKFTKGRDPAVITISARQTSSHTLLEVKDNGTGFDMTDSGRLFRVFERLHTQAEYEGTGVGLAISKRIMEKHGGTISIIGKKGKGATVTLKFPVKLTPLFSSSRTP